MASRFGALIEIDSSSAVTEPAAVAYKDWSRTGNLPDELTQEGPAVPLEEFSGTRTPATPQDVESAPQTPREAPASPVNLVTSLTNPPQNRWRFISSCLMFFAHGMSDSAPGALIPYIEKAYNIQYAVVSMIFVANAVGFITAAPLTHLLDTRLGRSKTVMLCMSLLIAGYVAILVHPPFGVVVVSYFVIGLGLATMLSLNNVFLANLDKGTEILGLAHGAYGIGGTVAPLIATAMASNGIRWSYFFSINIAVSLVNVFYGGWVFRNYEKDNPLQLMTSLQRTASHREDGALVRKKNPLKDAVKNTVTLLGALFIFAYQGAEVSNSGWIVSYLINYRNGDPAQVGYVSSGFWAGITIGRLVLTHFARRIGERVTVLALTIGTIVCQILTWLLPNIIGQAVAVAIVGLLQGPVYSCAMVIFNRLLPRNIQTTSIGLCGAMGSSGGAIAPFVTGLAAQQVGTVVLHPICLGLYGTMVVSWLCLPRVPKRSE